MQDFTIKELGELINAISKTPDAAIEVTTDKTGGNGLFCGNAGLCLKITPYHPATPKTDAAQNDGADDDV